ncbi:MAG: hypothetical protein GY748_12740 [Planctomycetaceae bacterium]|nr:hypothetical protein [Planctomycetaceae bacterium]
MKRRINSTGRKRIKREDIEISMLEFVPGQPLKAKALLDFNDYDFAQSASVVIEAYHRASGQRFDCGTIGALDIPPLLILDEVDRSGSVLFRVKVVDTEISPGMLLASAERIQPRSEDDQSGRKSLFPVYYRDLGQEVWKVEIIPDSRPVLILNNTIPEVKHKLNQNPLVQGFLLPAALRIVLEELVKDADGDGDESESWKEEWKQFCKTELGIADEPPDIRGTDDDRSDWIDRSVKSFTNGHRFIKQIKAMKE